MVNSGHTYQYIKAVVLQGLSKFIYMVGRSELSVENKRFTPLHRDRNFNKDTRVMLKYTEQDNWYTGISYKDHFRNGWKAWIRRKGDRRANNKRSKRLEQCKSNNQERPVTTAFFVPPTPMGRLAQSVQEEENSLDSSWGVKIVEKPGIPLWRKFRSSFPMVLGCYRGKTCCVCKGDGSKCMPK